LVPSLPTEKLLYDHLTGYKVLSTSSKHPSTMASSVAGRGYLLLCHLHFIEGIHTRSVTQAAWLYVKVRRASIAEFDDVGSTGSGNREQAAPIRI